MIKIIIFITIHFLTISALASEFDLTTNVRAVGMGGAYTAVVSDGDALFYNPASLAKVNGVYWKIIGLGLGLSNVEAISQLQSVQGGGGVGDTLAPLYGEPISLGANVRTAFTVPYFGFMYYNNINAVLSLQNPVYPELGITINNDTGYAFGFAFPIVPTFLYSGITFKRVSRTGGTGVISGGLLGDTNADLTQDVQNSGVGYSMDFGLNFSFPTPILTPTVAFVWKNAGITSFDNANLASDDENMILSGALEVDIPLFTITPSLEFRHLNNRNMQLTEKVHMGVEFGLPMLDIRAGFSQGYYSLGVGLALGPLEIDLATYGVEIGAYPGQIEDRRYVFSLTAELGVGGLGGIFDQFTGEGGEGGVGAARRKLKQRR